LLARPSVAIVGSRRASPYWVERAAELSTSLARAGVVIMSGLAEGIDVAAHTAAMLVGHTIAVIGTPLDRAYPAVHGELQTGIWERHLLVSPVPIGTATLPRHFPQRNRVMAGLSRATVILEASDKSGTLHQAAECVRLGRPIFVDQLLLKDKSLTWPSRFPITPFATFRDILAAVQ